MNAARSMLRALYNEGVKYFFMVPAKLINPFMSCYQPDNEEDIKPVVAAHEGGAAMMAEGYSRASEKFGVVIVLDGPGTANTIGGIASACADGYPLLMISGQIPSNYEMMGALQDSTQSGLDLATLLKPITTSSYHVRSIHNLGRYFEKSIRDMYAPKAKPTYLSIAKDVLLEEADWNLRKTKKQIAKPASVDMEALNEFLRRYVNEDVNIAIVAGARANNSRARQSLIRLSEKFDIPVATTVSSKGLFPESHRNNLGVYGYSGQPRAINTLLSDKIDVLIMLGFDVTQWTSLVWEESLAPNRCMLQVGSNVDELDLSIKADEIVVADEAVFLESLLEHGYYLGKTVPNNQKLVDYSSAQPLTYEIEKNPDDRINPAEAIQMLNEKLHDHICIADSGNHRSFATHYWRTDVSLGFYSANTICPMGWAIPAAIGISFAKENDPCVVITGDGCMLMHGMEIQTAARYKRNITYVVMNNAYYGATYFNNLNNIREMSELPMYDWAKFANAFGVDAMIVNTMEELDTAIERSRNREGTFLIDLRCSHKVETPAKEYKTRVKTTRVL